MGMDLHNCDHCDDIRYSEAVIRCESCQQCCCNNCFIDRAKYTKDKNGKYNGNFFPSVVINEDRELLEKFCPYCTSSPESKITDTDILNKLSEFDWNNMEKNPFFQKLEKMTLLQYIKNQILET